MSHKIQIFKRGQRVKGNVDSLLTGAEHVMDIALNSLSIVNNTLEEYMEENDIKTSKTVRDEHAMTPAEIALRIAKLEIMTGRNK